MCVHSLLWWLQWETATSVVMRITENTLKFTEWIERFDCHCCCQASNFWSYIFWNKTQTADNLFELNRPIHSFTLCLVTACAARSRAAKTRSPRRECHDCGQRPPLCPLLENGSSGEWQLLVYQGFFFLPFCLVFSLLTILMCIFFVSGCSGYGYQE